MVRGRCGRVNNDNNVRQWHITDINPDAEHVRSGVKRTVSSEMRTPLA